MNVIISVDDASLLGPLTKAFLHEHPLAPVQVEISSAVEGCALFSKSRLDWLFLTARLTSRDKSRASSATGVVARAGWKHDAGESEYSADFDFDLADLIRGNKGRDVTRVLAEAVGAIRALSVQTAAQVAVELDEAAPNIALFLSKFPDVEASLQPRRQSKRNATKQPARTMLDVQILHDGGNASQMLARRAELRELLEAVLRDEKLGVLDGSSSGERHYEFGFVVTNPDVAIEVMRATLLNAGVPASQIGFEVTGSQK